MMSMLRRACLAAGLFVLASPVWAAGATYQPMVDSLARLAPTLDREVLTHAAPKQISHIEALMERE